MEVGRTTKCAKPVAHIANIRLKDLAKIYRCSTQTWIKAGVLLILMSEQVFSAHQSGEGSKYFLKLCCYSKTLITSKNYFKELSSPTAQKVCLVVSSAYVANMVLMKVGTRNSVYSLIIYGNTYVYRNVLIFENSNPHYLH